MKKVLLTGICMLTTVFYSGNVQAQEATTQVTFTPDAANKTLTISGQGDLHDDRLLCPCLHGQGSESSMLRPME